MTSNAAPTGRFGIRGDYQHGSGGATRAAQLGRYWTWLRRHTHAYFQAEVYRLARELVRSDALRSVLDVGCGPGGKLRRYLGAQVEELVGVDQVGCAATWTNPGDGVRLLVVDLESGGVSLGRKFDLVMAVDVIEHLDDPDRLLDFMRAHMHERSRFLISTPEREILRGPHNLRSPKREHVREWNQDELRAYLESRALVVERHRVVDSYDTSWSVVMLFYRARDLIQGNATAHTQVVVGRIA